MTTIVWLRQDLRTRDNPALVRGGGAGADVHSGFHSRRCDPPGPKWRWGAAGCWSCCTTAL